MPSRIITLTTDFGLSDFTVAAVKGSILAKQPELTIVDISHQVRRNDLIATGIQIRSVLHLFPANTIHCTGVEPTRGQNAEIIVFYYLQQWLIVPNNGIIGLIADEWSQHELPKPLWVRTLSRQEQHFPMLHCYGDIITGIISNDPTTASLRDISESVYLMNFPRPIISDAKIIGKVIYIDEAGNAITDIDARAFRDWLTVPEVFLSIGRHKNETCALSENYAEIEEGYTGIISGMSGFLEVFISRGNAAELLGLRNGSHVIIRKYKDDDASQLFN